MTRIAILVEGYSKEKESRVAGTIGLVRSGSVTLVTDPGMVKDRRIIVDRLGEEGVVLEDLTHIFISHHHPDHTMNIALFPNAHVVDFWATYKNDSWVDHDNNFTIAEGIAVVRTPGHTEEDATLLVKSSKGVYAFTHLWWNEHLEPLEDPLAWDQKQLEENRKGC